jgi:hypothetical protein
MIKLKDLLLEVLEDVPRLLYHATFKELLPSIKQSGIISGDSKYRNFDNVKSGVYLAYSPEYASSLVEDSENNNIPKEWFGEIVILTIDTSKLNLSKLDRDPNDWPQEEEEDVYDDTVPSDETIHSFIYRGNIPFSAVVNINFEDKKPPTIFIPRRAGDEDRDKRYMVVIQKQIQNYIKNGGDNLDFSISPIQSIPDNLKFVNGDLNLFNTKIKSLPDNLTVDGTLNLNHTKLTKLPDNLTVIELYVDFTVLINQLPKNLKVTNIVYINRNDRKKVKKYTVKELKKLFPNVNNFMYMN